MFGRDEFEDMAKRLGKLKGTFILSLNDRPERIACFSRFRIQAVKLNYTIAAGKAKKVGEVIITGPSKAC